MFSAAAYCCVLTLVACPFFSRGFQVKGKAAIDGLGSRLGKSGASFMQQGLVLTFGNILNAAPIVAGVLKSRQFAHFEVRWIVPGTSDCRSSLYRI